MSFQIKRCHNNSQYVFSLLVTLCLLINLPGCYLPSKTNLKPSNSSGISGSGQPVPIEITFILQLTESIPEEAKIGIEILDEVTGLPYNKEVFDLIKRDDLTYSTKLSFPMGSVIKYRYSIMEDEITPEANRNGEPVRYRLFYAANTSVVKDHIDAWVGQSNINSSGHLTGTLLDANTKDPIPDIIVSSAGQLTFTDSNGRFILENLPPAIHNVVFYAMDGKYQTFQQEALIAAGQITPVNISMSPRQAVNLTFLVHPPNEALGAPIFIAGNISQLGNTFSDLMGSISIKHSKMPQLMMNDDGTYGISLQLYAGTYLRYKFTLGDGYWNSEQIIEGDKNLRQFIVPEKDITLDLSIDSWESSQKGSITFQVQIPHGSPSDQNFFIQLNNEKWTEPLPLWPIGNNNYLYILFSPLDKFQTLNYLICNQENCVKEETLEVPIIAKQIQLTEEPQTITINPDLSPSQSINISSESVVDAYIPNRGDGFQTSIEITPHLNSTHFDDAIVGISKLSNINASSIIFTPQWFFDENSSVLVQNFGATLFSTDLLTLLNTTKSLGFDLILFPQIGPVDDVAFLWGSNAHSAFWWEIWFDSYSNFILNYANIAQISDTKQLIMGGKFMLPTFNGGMYFDGPLSDLPNNSDDTWRSLIKEIRQTYAGELLWATNIHQARDPLPAFIDEFDGIYLLVDSPLAMNSNATFDTINWGFINVMDSLIYEVYRSTGLPIIIGFGYPSVDGAVLGCNILSNCINDGIFSQNEVSSFPVDPEAQSLIYNAVFPVVTSRDWITGVAIRGYNPTYENDMSSSSISGKPAFQVIEYWFSGLRRNDQ
jgi:hypothetical protein